MVYALAIYVHVLIFIYTHHAHPMQGPGTMGGALSALGDRVQSLHLRIAPKVLHFSAIHFNM